VAHERGTREGATPERDDRTHPEGCARPRARGLLRLLGDHDLSALGSSSEEIPKLQGPFDLVFLDHWKDLYKTDLELLEQHGMLRPGSIVVADNTGDLFSPETYLTYVRTCGRYDSESREAHIEYSQLPDAVEISVYRDRDAS
jgi:catechol O-methyltransferase